jgi:glucose/arabinose dehydrogenase
MRARVRIAVLAGCLLGALVVVPRTADAVSLQPVGDFNEPIFVTAPPGDPRLFVVERSGHIQVLHDGATSEYLDISALTTTDGERGLLSMAFDPSYGANGLFYVFYTGDGTDSGGSLGDIHIDEYRVGADPNVANPASRRTVMTFSHSAGNHNGGQIQFGKDGMLYISVGDNANSSNAQASGNPYGKILRIDPHGIGNGDHGVPADNPFVGGPTPEVWSLGLRNPFRFSFDHATGDIAIGDVGSSVFEEINYVSLAGGLGRGVNYGWPQCEGFVQGPDCGNPAYTKPVFAYADSDPCNAVIGGYVYRGTRAPEIAGRYLYSDLCHPQLRSLSLGTPLASDDRSEGVTLPSSPYAFGEDANCDLYVVAGSGSVNRIVGSAASAAPACSTAAATPATPIKKKKKKCKKRRHKKHRAAVDRRQRTRSGAAAVIQSHKKKRCKKRKKKLI